MTDKLGKDIAPLREKKLFLFDMDGTVYLGDRLFDGVTELLDTIDRRGGRSVFITNNSSRNVEDYVRRLEKMGIFTDREHFFTSTEAAILLMKSKHPGARIYAQGTESFIRGLRDSGLQITTHYEENLDVVLVGFDTEITGEKQSVTCEILTRQDVAYYATNPDWVCPVSFGYVPDCGSMCEGYFRATGKRPVFIGKPEPTMVLEVMKKFGVSPEETVVLGDRLYTDIASGVNAGVTTVCVLSGEVTFPEIMESQIKPTYILDSVADILRA